MSSTCGQNSGLQIQAAEIGFFQGEAKTSQSSGDLKGPVEMFGELIVLDHDYLKFSFCGGGGQMPKPYCRMVRGLCRSGTEALASEEGNSALLWRILLSQL